MFYQQQNLGRRFCQLNIFQDPFGLGCSPFNNGDYFDIGPLFAAVPWCTRVRAFVCVYVCAWSALRSGFVITYMFNLTNNQHKLISADGQRLLHSTAGHFKLCFIEGVSLLGPIVDSGLRSYADKNIHVARVSKKHNNMVPCGSAISIPSSVF